MKQLTAIQIKTVNRNLNKFFNLATKQEIKRGRDWYKIANDICNDIAQKYDTTPLKAAGVISALSPRNKWDQNIKDAYKVFEAIYKGLSPEQIKVCTFNTNKFKAFQIALGKVIITDKSLKTYNFVNNISHLSESHLTIDVWHLRACFNKSIKIDNASIGRLAYNQIKQLTIKKANKLGLTGYQYQAIIWESIRNNY